MNEIRDIHEPFIAWMKKRAIPYHRNRPDKKTTAIKGDPDFLITWMSHCLYIECKVPGNKLSADQEERIAYLRRAGNKVAVAYSLKECIEACTSILCVGEETLPVQSDVKGSGAVPEEPDLSGQNFYTANILGTEWVLARDTEGAYRQIRQATPADMATFPKAHA